MIALQTAYQTFRLFAQRLPEPDMRFEFHNGPPPEMAGAFIAGMLVIIVIALLVSLLIQAIVCYFVYKPLSTVPQQYRKISPGMVWLLMIPLFNLIWGFFVYPQVSQSLKRYAGAKGNQRLAATDCGEVFGWILAALVVASCIPAVGPLAALGSLVILIIYLIKINQVANELSAGYSAASGYASPGTPFPAEPPYSGEDDLR